MNSNQRVPYVKRENDTIWGLGMDGFRVWSVQEFDSFLRPSLKSLKMGQGKRGRNYQQENLLTEPGALGPFLDYFRARSLASVPAIYCDNIKSPARMFGGR
jgi:hypothetical protein